MQAQLNWLCVTKRPVCLVDAFMAIDICRYWHSQFRFPGTFVSSKICSKLSSRHKTIYMYIFVRKQQCVCRHFSVCVFGEFHSSFSGYPIPKVTFSNLGVWRSVFGLEILFTAMLETRKN